MAKSLGKKYDKQIIRKAIKARIDSDNEWALYGRTPSTRWNAPLPEYHFYMRNNKLAIKVGDSNGEVIDGDGNVIAQWVRKWSAKKVCCTYRELMPTISWA